MQFPRATRLINLVGAAPGPEQDSEARRIAREEKAAPANFLRKDLGLELAEAKTLVTPVTEPMRFLGHYIRVRRHTSHGRMVSATVVPRDRSQIFR